MSELYSNTKLDELISTYGLTKITKDNKQYLSILKAINNTKDLCIYGKAFIDQKLYTTWNTLAMFGTVDSNGHEIEQKNLSELHTYGIFTVEGQQNLISNEELQKGYLIFFCKPNLLGKLSSSLFNDPRICICINNRYAIPEIQDAPNTKNDRDLIIHNFSVDDHNKNNVSATVTYQLNDKNEFETFSTIPLTTMFDDSSYTYKTSKFYSPNINKILIRMVCVCIVNSTFGQDVNCSDILLEHLKNINAKKVI